MLPVTIEEICNGEWVIGRRAQDHPCVSRSLFEPEMNQHTGGNMSTLAVTPEIDGLKARLKATWMAGDYDRFSHPGAEVRG